MTNISDDSKASMMNILKQKQNLHSESQKQILKHQQKNQNTMTKNLKIYTSLSSANQN